MNRNTRDFYRGEEPYESGRDKPGRDKASETAVGIERGQCPEGIDRNMLLDSTLDVIAHTLSSGRCSFMVLDASGDELRIGRARGISSEVMSNARVKIGESIAGMVAGSREPLLIRDLDSHPYKRVRGSGTYGTSSLLSVPVSGSKELYGVLNVTDRDSGQPFDESDLVTLNLMASHLALCIEVGALHDYIRLIADTDGLTGVRNYRFFQENLTLEMERAVRFGQSLSLMMIDVNGLKDFNDAHGHRAGDEVLKEVARSLGASVRQIDLVSRYGGDEFTVVLPETDMTGAQRAASRIIQTLDARKAEATSLEGFEAITLSLGISSYPEYAGSRIELLEQSDRAMYRAKRGLPPHVCSWQDVLAVENTTVATGLLPAGR